MRILHTSDWHLGRIFYKQSLLEDQEYFIEKSFLPAVEKYHPDLVIIAGDIYDRQIAAVEAIRLFDTVIKRMNEMKIPLAVIAGNHDGAARMAVGDTLLHKDGIFIGARLKDVFHPVQLDVKGQKVCVYLLPYCEPVQIREVLGAPEDSLRSYQESYGALLKEIAHTLDPNAINIIVAHCLALNTSFSGSESPTFVGGSGSIDADGFDPFDYAAIGHLHGCQPAGKKGWYAGSPLKYSFDEVDQKKGMLLVDLEKGSEVKRTLLPIYPLRDVRRVKGTMQELLTQGKTSPSDDYLSVELTDLDSVFLPVSRLRPYFKNLLQIKSTANDREDLLEIQEKQAENEPPDQIFRHFMKEICGEEIADEDAALFAQLLREASGKGEEA